MVFVGLFYIETTVDQQLSLNPVPPIPTETEPSQLTIAVENTSDGPNIGDIQGLSVDEVAKRLVADALSKAVNHYCAVEDTTVNMCVRYMYMYIPYCYYCRRVLILANFSDFVFIAKFCPR